MKIRTLIAGGSALLVAAILARQAPAQNVAYVPDRTGSNKVWIEGTANLIHTTWWVGGEYILGMLVVGPGFPTEPGQAVTPGPLPAQATNVFIQARSLKSREKDGRLYSDSMDDVMYEHLKVEKFAAIRFHLDELTLKEAPKSKDAPYLCQAKGRLAVGGITNTITMPVSILPLGGGKLKITCTPVVKMSDYQVGPVDKNIVVTHIRTGDEVKLTLDWALKKMVPRVAASK